MATPKKSARSNAKEPPATNSGNSDNLLVEDEYGYVDTKGKKASSILLQQLPSRQLDSIVDDPDVAEKSGTTLRRRDSRYRKVQLRNASINYGKRQIGAQKIYEILTEDPDVDEADKMKTLRGMHQSLRIKRQVKERLDADKERKIATQTLGCWVRFKLAFLMTWQKFWHEVKGISYVFEPWHSSIKTIQGQFGSGVASYFIFLRWLLYINIWNFFTTFCFVVIPQLITETGTNYTSHAGNLTSDTFHASDLITGSGWFSDSLFYFGHYSGKVMEVIPNLHYNMPLAYLLTIGINAIINLIAVSSSITATYQKNYVDTAGGIKNVFCNKIFSGWDYAIETESAAQLQKRAFCNGMKELIYMKVQGEKKRSTKQKVIQRTLIALISLLCLAAIGAVGFLTYYILENKALKVDVRILQDMTLSLTVTSIAIVSYFVLNYATRLELYLSHRLRLYLTMIRVVTLRIVMLGIIAYFWIFILKPPRNMKVCYETELGKEIYRLILVNFLIETLIFTFFGEYGRKLISLYFSSVGRATFDVAYNTLDLIYYQTLAWIAIFCVPLGSLMIIIILVLLFYVKKTSMALTCKPPVRSWSVSEAQTFYLVLTFIMFFFAAITVGYSIFGSEPSDCGPFRNFQKTGDVVTSVIFGEDEKGLFTQILAYITSPGVLFAVFCALGLVVYFMRAQARAHISVIKKIREQLILASKDKVYLMKWYDEAYIAWKFKSSPNVNKDQESKNPPHQRNGFGSQHEVFNEGYTEYHDHLESPIHKKFSPSYTPANVPINIVNRENASAGFNNANIISGKSEGYRSPIASFGKESPLQMRKGSPYPVHQQGFRHLYEDGHKETHAD